MYNFEYIPTNPERGATPPAEFIVVPDSPEITADQASALGVAARAAAQSIYSDTIPGVEPRIRPLTPEELTAAKLDEVRQAGANIFELRQAELQKAA